MSWWTRLFSGNNERAATTDAPSRNAPPISPQITPDPIQPVLLYGTPSGPTEQRLRELVTKLLHSPRQREVISAVAQVYEAVPEDIIRQVALSVADRGDPSVAADFLNKCSAPSDLMLRADWLHSAGRTSEAVSLVERVLACDIGTPGARERHDRWKKELGAAVQSVGAVIHPDVTVAMSTAQQTPFSVLDELARGGAAVVYQARDELLQRDVALKIYHRASEDADQIEREATQAARFAGPGVVRVYDFDVEQGWIALGLYASGSLAQLLQRKAPLSSEKVRRWLYQLGTTLSRMHRQGAVHADLKPSNVLFSNDGQAILADFGMCVSVGSATPGGSTGYLSPERLSGQAIQPDDDVYAFGRLVEDIIHSGVVSDGSDDLRQMLGVCLGPRRTRPSSASELVPLLSSSG